ncbi:hypothetical protein llh_3220 [Lactococcus cremoris subsp. cremoris A76]|uniref:hypothetical protein n=1 Tax=Lactococcus TaxID=1357 RepID=UPI000238CC19|nr:MULTISPECIES: hypothetical protein [Lactococcus]AEU39820.1 hypothetical protein llh_3220 [Lactococcus cremoris subsp. cremoris A76]MCH5354620.1 hypothetical protein [Lactococcus lactis]MCT0444877.1 hypothetical protein [Lactococcus lactis subsp. lactis]
MLYFFTILFMISIGFMIYFFIKRKWKYGIVAAVFAFVFFLVVGFLPSNAHDDVKKVTQSSTKTLKNSSKINKNSSNKKSSSSPKEKTSVSNTDEKNFYDDLAILEDSLSGIGVTSISKGQLDYPAAKITLDSSLGEVSKIDAQNSISDINKKIVAMVANDGTKNPQLSYYIGSIKVAENRSILEPSEVKFTSSLK